MVPYRANFGLLQSPDFAVGFVGEKLKNLDKPSSCDQLLAHPPLSLHDSAGLFLALPINRWQGLSSHGRQSHPTQGKMYFLRFALCRLHLAS